MPTTLVKILALDQATHTGWAHSDGTSGIWDLSVARDESSGWRLLKLRQRLTEVKEQKGVDVLVFEASRNSKFGNAVKVAAQIQAVIEMWCLDNKIEYKGFSPKTIKLFATGSGNASKDAMIETAKEKWKDIEILDDNHADALWLLEYAKSIL